MNLTTKKIKIVKAILNGEDLDTRFCQRYHVKPSAVRAWLDSPVVQAELSRLIGIQKRRIEWTITHNALAAVNSLGRLAMQEKTETGRRAANDLVKMFELLCSSSESENATLVNEEMEQMAREMEEDLGEKD